MPVVVGCMFWQSILDGGLWLRWVALVIFIAAGVTDFLDGYFARMRGASNPRSAACSTRSPTSSWSSSCLLMLAAEETIHGWALLAAVVILCREILVSGLREYLAELRVSVPVTRLAKWKTTLQLVAVGFLIAGEAGDAIVPVVTQIGIALLWLSALLTLYTGWDYLQAGSASSHQGGRVKLLYFAWVRERIGKAEEEIDPPAGVATVGELVAWLAQRGEEYAYAFENPKVIRAAIDRSHVRADAQDRRRERDRLLPADDRRVSERC